jgi:glucose/arabinose dehydrogenase
VAAILLCAPATAGAASYPTGFEERTIVSGLTQPTGMAWAPDGRMFVIEKGGVLKVVAPGGSTATTVLNLSADVNSYWDRGLLGIAVDSNFASNRYVYLLYTYELLPMTPDGDGQMTSRLDRIEVGPTNAVSGRTTILGTRPRTAGVCPAPDNAVDCIPSEGFSHSIGSVRSAPDGTLWVGSGDAASFNFVDTLALRTYDERSMAGKIMHVDRNGQGVAGHPFCPANNNLSHVCTKLWAGGFRNPFRFKLRPGGAGLTVGDVGWGVTEEIDIISTGPGGGGRLYGWPCYEGSGQTGGYKDLSQCQSVYRTPGVHVDPTHQYAHNADGGAVIGGPTYTSGPYPGDFQGDVFFGDYPQGFIRKLNLNGSGQVTGVDNFATGWGGVDIELTPGGELAWADIGGGAIRRVVYTAANRSPVAVLDADRTSGTAPLDVAFDGRGSSDPDGDPISYSWSFGDGGTSTAAAPIHRYVNPGSYTAQLTVRDGRGGENTDTQTISVGSNTPPSLLVSGDTTYRGGEPFELQASVSDAQDQPFPGNRISWDVRVIHGSHTHFIGSFSGATLAQNGITDHDADSFYRIVVTANDSGGLRDEETVELTPETTTVRLRSNPSGAPLSYGGRAVTAPQDLVTAIGYRTTVTASDVFSSGGAPFDFMSWSNGGARVQNFTVPTGGADLLATYRRRTPTTPPLTPPPPPATPTPPPGTPTPPPAGPAPAPPADTTGPTLELTGLNATRGRIRGSADDESGVEWVQVALRRRLNGAGCSWWLRRKRKMSGAPRSCARPRWMDAKLRPSDDGVHWLLALGRALPPGGYRVLARAEDGEGNKDRLPVTRASLVRVE